MNYLVAVFSLVLVLLLGDLASQSILSRSQQSVSVSLRLAIAWGFGTGTLALIVFYTSLINAGSGYVLSMVIVSSLAVFQLIRVFANVRFSQKRAGSFFTDHFPRLILAIILIAGLWYVASAAGLGLDGTAHWGIKAKASFLEGGWRFFPTWLNRFPHENYPLLVPTQQGWLYTFLDEADTEAVKIVFVSFYLSLGSLFFHSVRPYYSSILAIVYTILMMATPLLAISSLPAYADVPLMFFVFGSVIFIRKWLSGTNKFNMILGATLASFALLVKMEGIMYWLVSLIFVFGYAFWHAWRSKSAKVLGQAALFPLITVLVAGSWFLYTWIADLGVRNFASPTLSFLIENSDRLPVIFERLLRQMFLGVGYWGLLWFLFLMVTIWKWRNLRKIDVLYLWVSVVFPIALLSFSFMLSLWPSYVIHVDTALPRLIMHTVPMAWLFVASQTSEVEDWFQTIRTKS